MKTTRKQIQATPEIETYGRLLEGIHITGYSFARACRHLEQLIESDDWRRCGDFADINEFMDSIKLDQLRATAEERKRIAARIKALQPKVSNRQIAKTIGVDERTVRRDTAANAARPATNASKNKGDKDASAANAAALSGGEAARIVQRQEAKGARGEERAALHAADEARVASLMSSPGRFRTLVVDPPWDYEWLSIAGRAKPGYATMTHEQLLALDVAQWAEEVCHLYLWTTNNFMTRAVELMAKWGFQHKTVLTWVKPRWGLGSYFRNSTEHVLFGVRGELRTRSDSIATHFEAPVGEHSVKPERFYEIVRAASFPPYGEGFQRQARADFTNLFIEREAAEAAE